MIHKKKRYDESVYEANPAKTAPNSGHKAKIKEKRRRKRKKRFGRLLVVIQLLLTLVFIWTMFELSILPMKILLPIIGGLFVVLWLIAYSQKRINFGSALGKMVSIAMIIVLGAGSYYVTVIDAAFDNITANNSADSEVMAMDLTQNTFHIYLSGNDVFDSMESGSRSDVNMIATVNPKSHQVLLTTTPRDAYVVIPEVSNGQRDKLTHAGIYGVDASMATLSNLYETDIKLYVRVNFNFIIEIVEELGGIDVYSEYEFTTKDGYQVEKGMNHFDGKQALSFCRERKALPGGDNQRGKNQQAVIVALAKKMLSPKMLLATGSIIESVSDSVDTNISRNQMETLILKQLGMGGSWEMRSVAAEGTPAKEYTYSMPNKRLYVTKLSDESIYEIMDLMNQVESGQKIEGSEALN